MSLKIFNFILRKLGLYDQGLSDSLVFKNILAYNKVFHIGN